MRKFKLEGGLLKEVPSMEKPNQDNFYANGNFAPYLKHVAYGRALNKYKEYLTTLKSYPASEALIATGKVDWEEGEFEVRGESVINQKGPCPWYLSVDSHESALFAYPLDEVKEDVWEHLNRTVEAMTGKPFQKWELDTLRGLFKLSVNTTPSPENNHP